MDPSAAAQKRHLLIVEDEPGLLRVLTLEIEFFGYRATACESAPLALSIFRQNPDAFDLVLTDFWMPELNGVEMSMHILALRQVPILLMSGFCEGWSAERVKSVGIRDLLHKPVATDALREAIEAAIGIGKRAT